MVVAVAAAVNEKATHEGVELHVALERPACTGPEGVPQLEKRVPERGAVGVVVKAVEEEIGGIVVAELNLQ